MQRIYLSRKATQLGDLHAAFKFNKELPTIVCILFSGMVLSNLTGPGRQGKPEQFKQGYR
jgi:hypothetical protein